MRESSSGDTAKTTPSPTPGWTEELGAAALLTLLSFVGAPYVIGLEDHVLWVPGILRATDPTLLSGDILFLFGSQQRFSVFVPWMSALASVVPLDVVFFGLSVLTRGVFAWTLLRLGRILGGSLLWAIPPAAAALVVPLHNMGTATLLFETLLYPRTFGAVFGALAVIHWLVAERRIRWWLIGGLTGLAASIHVISALPLGLLFGADLLRLLVRAPRRSALRSFAWFTTGFMVGVLPLVIQLLSTPATGGWSGGLFVAAPEWLEVIRMYGWQLFPDQARTARLLVAFPSAICVAYAAVTAAQRENRAVPVRLGLLIIVVALLVCIGTVFTVWAPVPLVIQLQVTRAVFLLHIVGLAAVALICKDAVSERTLPSLALAALSFLSLSTGAFYYTTEQPETWPMVGQIGLLLGLSVYVLLARSGRLPAGPRLPLWTFVLLPLVMFLQRPPDLGIVWEAGFAYLPDGVLVLMMSSAAVLLVLALSRLRAGADARGGRLAAVTTGMVVVCCAGFTWMGDFHGLDDAGAAIGVDELSTWARASTEKDALFAVDLGTKTVPGLPLDRHLRVHAQRSLWFCERDIAQALFLPNLFVEWQRRRALLQSLAGLPADDPERIRGLRAEGVGYYLTRRPLPALAPVAIIEGLFAYEL